ncbi:MAG: alpha/beta hydrolase [Betaproteobacteria bacterium]
MSQRPQPLRRQILTSDGVSLSLLDTQKPGTTGLTLVLVPGWCMPARLWSAQVEGLADAFRILAFDPRGQGESQVPVQGYHFERRSQDLHELIEPLSRVLLVGWSLGALEVLEYVHRYGEAHLAGLVLVDSSVGELPVPAPGGEFLKQLRENRDSTLEAFVRSMVVKAWPLSEVQTLLSEIKRMSLDHSIALLSSGIAREHWKKIAHAVGKPLGYVVTPEFIEQAKNLQINRPGTQIELFANSGHALFIDEPKRFNQWILEFAATLGQ